MLKRVVSLLTLLVVFAAALPALADNRRNKTAMSVDQIKSIVAEAAKKDRRLIVQLKGNKVISGHVFVASDDHFQVTQYPSWFRLHGQTAVITVSYTDVASVKGRNPFVKAFKEIGAVTLLTAS